MNTAMATRLEFRDGKLVETAHMTLRPFVPPPPPRAEHSEPATFPMCDLDDLARAFAAALLPPHLASLETTHPNEFACVQTMCWDLALGAAWLSTESDRSQFVAYTGMHALRMYEVLPADVKRVVKLTDLFALLHHLRARDTVRGMFGPHEDPRFRPHPGQPQSCHEGCRSIIAGFVADTKVTKALEAHCRRIGKARQEWWRGKFNTEPPELAPTVSDVQCAALEAAKKMADSRGASPVTPRRVLTKKPPRRTCVGPAESAPVRHRVRRTSIVKGDGEHLTTKSKRRYVGEATSGALIDTYCDEEDLFDELERREALDLVDQVEHDLQAAGDRAALAELRWCRSDGSAPRHRLAQEHGVTTDAMRSARPRVGRAVRRTRAG